MRNVGFNAPNTIAECLKMAARPEMGFTTQIQAHNNASNGNSPTFLPESITVFRRNALAVVTNIAAQPRTLRALWLMGGRGIDKPRDALEAPIAGHYTEIRAAEIEWGLLRTACVPTEADIPVMRLDPAL